MKGTKYWHHDITVDGGSNAWANGLESTMHRLQKLKLVHHRSNIMSI